eukprot:13251799-Ditylum_brightwellii.AAC.1
MSSLTATNGATASRTQTNKLSWDDNADDYKDLVQEAMDMEAVQELGWKRTGDKQCKNNVKRGKTNGK